MADSLFISPTIGTAMNKLKLNTLGLVRNTGKAGLAALIVAASMTVTASPAMAAPTCFTTPIPVPVSTAGIYVNLFTGVANVAPASATGWDFNPWGSGNLFFYVPAASTAGFVTSAGLVANLAPGTLVDGSSTYIGNASAEMTTYREGVTNGKLGMRFVEAGNTYYAWVNVTTTGPATGLPATINNWCYESTPDTGINVGTTPVSLQSFSID